MTDSVRMCRIYLPPSGGEPKILLVKEKPSPVKQKDGTIHVPKKTWKMFGGKDDVPGESLIDAMVHESDEECHLKIDPAEINPELSFRDRKWSRREGDAKYHTITTFLCTTNEEEVVSPGEDIIRAQWIRLSKVAGVKLFYRAELALAHRWYIHQLLQQYKCREYLSSVGTSSEYLLGLLSFKFENN